MERADSSALGLMQLENGPRQASRKRGKCPRRRGIAPTPGMTSFDPSFDDAPNQPAAQSRHAAPVAPVPNGCSRSVDESLPESDLRVPASLRDYGKAARLAHSRFKYRNKEELIEKLTAAHSAASAHIRELSRNNKLEEIASAGPTEKNFTPSTTKSPRRWKSWLMNSRTASTELLARRARSTE